jgi:hypothetical protein
MKLKQLLLNKPYFPPRLMAKGGVTTPPTKGRCGAVARPWGVL